VTCEDWRKWDGGSPVAETERGIFGAEWGNSTNVTQRRFDVRKNAGLSAPARAGRWRPSCDLTNSSITCFEQSHFRLC
jgi:hypothetical protein